MPHKRKLPPVVKGKKPNRAERRALADRIAKRLLGQHQINPGEVLFSLPRSVKWRKEWAKRDQAYLEWLAAAPKGVRWDKAQEMWEEYNRRQREQAQAIAKRLLGKSAKPERIRCGDCFGQFTTFCKTCLGEGEVDA